MCGANKPPVYVRYRIWHDHRLAVAARESHGRELAGARRLGPRAEDLTQSEIVISVWRIADRLRVEHAGGMQDGAFGVRVGERWWSWDPHQGRTRSSDRYPPDAAWVGKGADTFLDPAELHRALRFGPVSHGTRVSRPTLIAEARVGKTFGEGGHSQSLPRAIGVNADRYRLEVDAQHGFVLSVHAFLSEQAYQTIDVIELQVDGPVNTELFEFREPPASQTAA